MWLFSSERLKNIKPFKRLDLIIYALVIITVLSLFLFFVVFAKQGDFTSIQLSIDGKIIAKYEFSPDKVEIYDKTVTIRINDSELLIFTVNDDNNENEVVISKTQKYAYVKSANCSSQDCVYSRKITRAGDSIICAPHKLVIKGAGDSLSDPILG